MVAFSNFLEAALINATLRNVTYTPATSGITFISLYTTDPTDADSGTEVAASGYDRFEVSAGLNGWTTASGGSSRNGEAWEFVTATTAWGTITHFGVHDATINGNLLYHGVLATSKVVGTDDIVRFPIDTLSIKLD